MVDHRMVRAKRLSMQGTAAGEQPRGILLVGVQSGGKGLAAKAVAGVWQVPLRRLDFGMLYNKFFGETESNLRKAPASAELFSPCVRVVALAVRPA